MSPIAPSKNPIELWPIQLVAQKTRKSKSAIYRDAALGVFPKPVKTGARSSAWVSTEIEQWISDCIAKSRGNSPEAA